MHRHRLRAFVTTIGETDVPVTIFAAGQYVRYIAGVGLMTTSLGPGSSTINALATWGDTTATQLLNTSVLLDASGNMTNLVTLDAQDAPRITATLASASPVTGHLTKWASSAAPWKLDQTATLNVINEDGADSIYGVGTINGIIPTRWVLGPISGVSTDNAIVRWDGTTGRLVQNSTVAIDDSGNITGVTTINGTAPGNFMKGAASSTANALVTYADTTGKQASNVSTITSTFGQLSNVTDMNGTLVPSRLWVAGPTSAPDARVCIWNGTDGRLITSAAMSIDGAGNVTNVTTLNGVNPATWVVGPASATSGGLATFSGTTGKLIQSATTITASGTALSNVGTLNSITVGTTTLANVSTLDGVDPLTWVVGPASATTGALATFNGTTGKLIQSGTSITASGTTLSSVGAINSITVGTTTLANVSTINTIDPLTWVVGPASATNTAIARYNGTTGKLIQNSSATIDAGGNITAGTYNGVNVALHAARHLPGGADDLTNTSNWQTGDSLTWNGSGTLYRPKWSTVQSMSSASIGGSFTGPTGSSIQLPNRSGPYMVEWRYALVLGDSTANFDVVVSWTVGSGEWVLLANGSGAFSSNGTLLTGNTGGVTSIVVMHITTVLSSANSGFVTMQLRSGGTGFSVVGAGLACAMEN